MTPIAIAKELESLPANLKQEVIDFIAFLKTKKTTKVKSKSPKFGSLKGKIKIHSGFDEPLDEFKDYI